jgi:uncharacterized protein (DUF1684 family)
MLSRPAGSIAAARRLACRMLFALALPVLVSTGCKPNTEEARPYPERIQAQRAAKDDFFRRDGESPITPDKRDAFLPLAYFAIDAEYVAPAQLAPSPREPGIVMPTSTGQRRRMRRAGSLQFSMKGRPHTLTAFVDADAADMSRLFVPFGDLTNGTETYAAGRYIDLVRTPTGLYEIDFNKAYQPYCYYNPTYDCPYPPAENRLNVPVRAGERMKP